MASSSERPLCEEPGCKTRLSKYNKAKRCFTHDRGMPRTRGRPLKLDLPESRSTDAELDRPKVFPEKPKPKVIKTRPCEGCGLPVGERRWTTQRGLCGGCTEKQIAKVETYPLGGGDLGVVAKRGELIPCPYCVRKCANWSSFQSHARQAHNRKVGLMWEDEAHGSGLV